MKKLKVILLMGMLITLTACKNDAASEEPQPEATIESDGEIVDSNSQQEEPQPEEVAEEPVNPGKIDEDMIMRYLNGEVSAMIDLEDNADLGFCCMYEEETDGQTQYLSFHNGMELLTFKTLYEMVKETSDGITEDPTISYAIATTKSGTDAMIIRFGGIGIEGGEPTIYSCFIFTLDNERNEPDVPFNLVYAFDSWSRHYVEIDEGLYFNGYIVNGAGDSTEWGSTIDENGKYRLVYKLKTLDEDWVAMYGEDKFNIKYDNYEWSRGSHFDILSIADGSYYSYSTDENVDKDKMDEFIKALKDNGLSETGDVNKLKDDMLKNADIDTSALSEFDGFVIYGD